MWEYNSPKDSFRSALNMETIAGVYLPSNPDERCGDFCRTALTLETVVGVP